MIFRRITKRAGCTIFAWGLLSAAVALAEPGEICDRGLLGSEKSPIAYQLRGNRCEGIYKLEVNSELLHLVSIVGSFEAFDSSRAEDLTVEWSLPPELPVPEVRLRAVSLVSRSFYRMDTVLAASPKSFSWPLEILEHLKLTKEDLGVRAWVRHPRPPDKDFEEIYLPLRLWQQKRPVRPSAFEVTFLPEVKLKETYVSFFLVDLAGQRRGAAILDKQPLEYGYYPAKTPVIFEIPRLGAAGYYQVDLLTQDAIGGSMTFRFLFYDEGQE